MGPVHKYSAPEQPRSNWPTDDDLHDILMRNAIRETRETEAMADLPAPIETTFFSIMCELFAISVALISMFFLYIYSKIWRVPS